MNKGNCLQCASAAIVLALAASAARASSLPVCGPSITDCCKITGSGTFTVTGALTQTVLDADCIDIDAANVNLYTGGFAITGPGKAATGVGIKITKAAHDANLQLGVLNKLGEVGQATIVSGFGTGIKIKGNRALLYDFDTDSNVGDGVLLIGATHCFLMSFESDGNGGNGLTIKGGSGCQIDDFNTDANTNGVVIKGAKSEFLSDFGAITNNRDGISITAGSRIRMNGFHSDGNSANGILVNGSTGDFLVDFIANGNSGAGVELANASSNQLASYDAYNNGTFGTWLNASDSNIARFFLTFGNTIAGVYLGCSSSGPSAACSGDSSNNLVASGYAGPAVSVSQEYGVAVDTGDLKNLITGIQATGDSIFDLFDGNPDCGTNIWVINEAGASHPSSCISTTP
jgi:hypothetical protein